jgi:hypothetical protein
MHSISMLFNINHDVQLRNCMDYKWVECIIMMARCEVLVVVFLAERPLCSKLWKISSSLSRFSLKGDNELFRGPK